MPQASKSKLRFFKPVLAGLMAFLLLVLSLASAHERLHTTFHADTNHAHESCPVCVIGNGQLDAPAASVTPFLLGVVAVCGIPAIQILEPSAVDLSSASSRGPPASVSSLL
jgi:hypothetical protein